MKKKRDPRQITLMTTGQRPLTLPERQACEDYLQKIAPRYPSTFGRLCRLVGWQRGTKLRSSKQVYSLTHSITRYGLSFDLPQQWRYYLDAVEVHLPPFWESLITTENHIELIYTDDLPLIISLNGHSLLNDSQQALQPLPQPRASTSASILNAQGDNVELKQVRHQTEEEYLLTHQEGIYEVTMICLGLLGIFISLLVPLHLMFWLLLPAVATLLLAIWLLFRKPPRYLVQEIKVLRGIPKRWGLFGESHEEDYNVSLGVLDLQYPDYWKPYIHHDLGQVTDIEIDNHHQVVKQGKFLSLADEVRAFPLQKWRKNLLLAGGSLLILLLSVSLLPVDMPFKISASWLRGIQHIESSTIEQLPTKSLQVGSIMRITGRGMCSVPKTYQSNRSYDYLPFDCSAIYWNSGASRQPPSSEVITQTQALLATTHAQLHPGNTTTANINPQLALAIQKSGMILLSNFTDIINKTLALCGQENDCQRLKNALVNLENAKDWPTLVKQARSGKLSGLNVLLRPTSAQNLEHLINNATASFISQETKRAIEGLTVLPPGGLLLVSDQGQQFVEQDVPDVPLFDLPTAAQWDEFQRLAAQLLNTPFQINGIITSVTKDSHGTLRIVLHDEPSILALWRYLFIALLIAGLAALVIINLLLGLRRLRADCRRNASIRNYYDQCVNLTEPSSSNQSRLF